ncbi:methyl-accepting chemotaxis protein [Clostridium algifaecis]|uniref:Methyl-accepting chemotaxis protein n=1 Tax=Clostridium algifaecis TaxID=1472040 RepID=A0ABS4KUH0_9CLOT|nr:methyl-accepting chemotaxis protein [Clostridium algifaecis]MBP2033704.1 methyl-accepting chemotaxis protein [Clostridium algifaecis]
MSIKKKIPMFIGILVLITMLVASSLVYYETSSKLYSASKVEMDSLVDSYVITMEHMIDKEQIKVEGLTQKKSIYDILNLRSSSANSDAYKSAVNTVSAELDAYVKKEGNLEHAFIVDKTGTIIADSDRHLINTSISDRNYNIETLKGKNVISETMTSKSTKAQIIVFSSPLIINGNLYGYSAAAVVAKSFSTPFKNVTVSQTQGSYAYLVDEKGNIIFHPDTSKIGKPVENSAVINFVNDMKKGKNVGSKFVDYTFQGDEKIAYCNLIPGVKWTFVLSANKSAIVAGARKITLLIVSMMLVLAIISILVGAIISKRIINPIEKVKKIIDKTSKLDLKSLDEADEYKELFNYKDEIGDIFRSILTMRKTLKGVVDNLSSESNKVTENAAFLENLTKELKQYVEETSNETDNISAGMEENSAVAEEIAASSGEMGNAVNDMANKAEEGSKNSEDVSKKAEELKESSNQSKMAAKNIYNDIKNSMENAIEDSKSVNKINELTEGILDITEQTNLLSLNASIEAARAGEAGKGFAVVADEVRQLAEQSSQTAENIKNVVGIVESSVKKLVDSSSSILKFLENTVNKDYDKFGNVAVQYNKDADTMNEFMMDFSAVSEELNASIEGIVKAVGEMAQTVSDGASGIQNVSEKTSNIFKKLENINSTATKNRESADVLKEIIEKFSI